MAKVSDYEGKFFGNFHIARYMTSGNEADVFYCVHMGNNIPLILRLDSNDKQIWNDQPIIPPKNYSLESKNSNGIWHMSSVYYFQTMEALKKDKDAWKMVTPAIYGVLNNRYLISVASPIRVKKVVEINDLLKYIPSSAVDGYGPMEVIILLLATTASLAVENNDVEHWKNDWSYLTGGTILTDASKRYLLSGTQSSYEKEKAIQLVSESNLDQWKFEVPENILMRLCSAIARGFITIEEAKATLACQHFRVNISYHEINQIIHAYNALKSQAFPDKETIDYLQFILYSLSEPPLDPYQNPEAFELREEQPDITAFELFLQENAGASTKYPQVELE